MNRHFSTISSLLRHTWAIEPVWAEQHMPLVTAYLAGQLDKSAFLDDDEEDREPCAYVVATGPEAADAPTRRYGLSDSNIPAGSVAIIKISGAIMKQGFCGSYGTEDYTAALNEAYANKKIIGAVCLVDSPGGQLSGTPTLFDTIRNPAKPTVALVNDGLMASAAYWLACGADYIMASQKTDQIGSIGVFVRMADYSARMAQMGIKEITVYSDLSSEKNKPYKDALAGDTKLLKEDLNESARLFRQAVEEGREGKLNLSAGDPFKGAVFYANKALEIGLIDGFGDLNAAVAKVVELHNGRGSSTGNSQRAAEGNTPDTFQPTDSPKPGAAQEDGTATGGPETIVQTENPDSEMFGDKHKDLSALKGREATTITVEELTAINANLDALGIAGVRVTRTDFIQEAEESVGALKTANAQITTLQGQLQVANEKAEKYGSQPGTVGTRSQKVEETTTTTGEKDICDTDAQLAALKAQMG